MTHLFIENSLLWYQRLIAAFPGVTGLVLISRYTRSGQFRRLPFLEYAVAQLYLFWGLPAVVYDRAEGLPVTRTAMTEAAIAVAVTTLVMVLAHPLGTAIGRAARPVIDRFLPPNPPQVGTIVYLPWLTVGVVAAAGLVGFLPTEVRFAVSVLATYYPLLTYTAMRAFAPDAPRWTRLQLFIATVVLSLAGLLTGMTEWVVRPLLVTGALFIVLRKRVPTRWLVLGAATVALLQPVKGYYRESAWDEDERISTDAGLAASRWADAFAAYWSQPSPVYSASSGSLWSRLNELSPIARTFEFTPSPIGYDYGESWSYLVVAAVPRALMPNKPTPREVFNDRYNLTFGLQPRSTIGLSTNGFPLVADGYWNFGWFGVVFVAAVLGVLLGVFASTVRLDSWASLTLGVANFAELRAHTYLLAHLGGLLQRYVGITLACWIAWAAMRLMTALLSRLGGRRWTRRQVQQSALRR